MPPKTKVDAKKAEADRLQALVMALLREEENKYCSDCDAKQPRWASWNLGVFICIRCAGIHRNLGVHISKVKSVNLDSWTAEQVQSMRVMGNAKAKAVYEAELPEHFRRPQTDQTLENFIRAKYEQKRYMMRDWVPPRVDVNDLPSSAAAELRSPSSAAPPPLKAPVAAKNSLSPKPSAAAMAPASSTGIGELLDFSSPAPAAASQQPATLLDFGGPATVVSSPTSSDLDDLFGGFVSAPSAVPTTAPATSVQTAPSNGNSDMAGLGGDLTSLGLGAPAVEEKKSTNDILALFGNIPKSQPPSQPMTAQQPPQQFWGAGLSMAPAAVDPLGASHPPPSFGGFPAFAAAVPAPIPQATPAPAPPPQNTKAFDSLSLNNLFPSGLSSQSFGASTPSIAFSAASAFPSAPAHSSPQVPVFIAPSAATFNIDSLL